MGISAAVAARHAPRIQYIGAAFGTVILAACLWFLLNHLSLMADKVLDDSYITYLYALNLAEGHGLRYNPTDIEPTEGGTSMLHILVAAGGIKLGIDPLTTTRLVSLAAFFGAVLALARAICIVGRTGFGVGLAASSIVATLVVMLPETGAHFAKGMETIAFFSIHMALAAWALVAIYRAPHFSLASILTGAVLALMLGLSRPEGILISAGIFALTTFAAALKTGRINLTAAEAPAAAAGLYAIAIGLFLAWKVWYFGDALPNAYWVKSHNKIFGDTGILLPGLSQVGYFMVLRFIPLAMAALALFALAGTHFRSHLPYIAVAIPGLIIALLYMKAIHEVAGGFRYGFPMLAPLFVLFGLGMASVLLRYPQVAVAGCVAGLMGVTTIGASRSLEAIARTHQPKVHATSWIGQEPSGGPLERLALDLRDTGLGQDATIYLSAAGLIPYRSRFHAIDWIGLNNNTLSGANEMSLDEVWAYIHSTNPDVIQTVVPPATVGSTSRFDDPAFNSPAVKDLLRGRVKLFYYWDREIVAEMLWREMIWIRDNASFAACYELRGTWSLFAYVIDRSEHASHIATTLANSGRSGCNVPKTREDYASDPFRGVYEVAFTPAAPGMLPK